jgi:hypothetical protein
MVSMTLDGLMKLAAEQCIDEREAHLVIFTEGFNGYVCPNEGLTVESRAVYRGTYRDCQIWVERQGLSAALQCMLHHWHEVPELAAREMTAIECSELASQLAVSLSPR